MLGFNKFICYLLFTIYYLLFIALKIVTRTKAVVVVVITAIIVIAIESTGICIIIPIIRAENNKEHTQFIFPSFQNIYLII